jgi:hypothetical protein
MISGMNRILSTFLILLLFAMHSAWAISVHIDVEHNIDLSSHHIESVHQSVADQSLSDADKGCDEHNCHISSHATALFSYFNLSLTPSQQYIDKTVTQSRYFYAQTTPQRPPKA